MQTITRESLTEKIREVYRSWYHFFIQHLEDELTAAVPDSFDYKGLLLYTFDTSQAWHIFITKEPRCYPVSAEARNTHFLHRPFNNRTELTAWILDYYRRRVLPSPEKINNLTRQLDHSADLDSQIERLTEAEFGLVETGIIFQAH